MDTNQKKAAQHSQWVEKLISIQDELTPHLTTLEEQGFHEIHRQLETVFEKLTDWGDAKKALNAMKLAKRRSVKYHGAFVTDSEIVRQKKLINEQHTKAVERPLRSLYEHFRDAQHFPIEFNSETQTVMTLIHTFFSHMRKQFKSLQKLALHTRRSENLYRDIPEGLAKAFADIAAERDGAVASYAA